MLVVLFQKILQVLYLQNLSVFKSNEGIQLIESNTDNPIRPNPLAQTFKVENLDGGCFVTGVDLFFSKKSTNIPVKILHH